MSQRKKAHPAFITVPTDDGFFISANGYSGFRSRHIPFYNSEEYTRVFVITGGPGTGKSRLMHEVADEAKNNGASVRYVHCSSDPDSLDGIIMQKEGIRIAVLDGTAPHVRVIDHPGVIDEWIDLSACWSTEDLQKQRREILTLSKQKKDAYARAYRFLRIAGEADQALAEEVRPALQVEKLSRAVKREMRSFLSSAIPQQEEYYISACSMKGHGCLTTHRNGSTTVAVSDEYGAGHFYLDFLCTALRNAGIYSFIRMPSCFTDKKTESIYLPENMLLFSTVKEGGEERSINIKRFLDARIIARRRQEIRHLIHVRQDMQNAALSALGEAGRYHFSLERIYGEAMDFSKKETITAQIKARICLLLKEESN